MTARYSDLRVSVSPTHNRLDAAFTLVNRSAEEWSSQKGYFIGRQVLDASSGNLLMEGPRTPFPSAVKPGESVEIKLSCELPPEAGSYRVYISPLRENVAWFYERGSPFLLLDVETNGGARIRRKAVTTLRRLQIARWLRTIHRAFVYPLRTMVQHRSLIRSMVRRDIVGRYRGSYGGLFWTVIHPLLMMLTYYFVFGVVLQTRFGDDGRPSNFVLYFLAGMLPWLAFSEAIGRAPTTVFEHSNFVKKLVFPIETLPVNLVVAGLFSETFGVGVFLAGMAYFDYPLPATALYLPLVLLPQFLLTLGLSWLLAALGVFFRDLGQINAFLLTVWFFMTPICYPQASLPPDYLWLFEKNPLFVLVESYRSIFLQASPPDWGALGLLTAFSAGLFVLGYACFYKLKSSFADLL